MILTSIEFDSKDEDLQSCYRYEIDRFTISDYLRGMPLCLLSFDPKSIDKIYHYSLEKELFGLYGIMIEVCSDPYDRTMILAISDSIDELSILVDLHSLAPIVNKV